MGLGFQEVLDEVKVEAMLAATLPSLSQGTQFFTPGKRLER